ncbi:MAG: hypothetical protein RLZZ590_245 [Actinomycetota bacterium]|jgi:allophanate hydrolase
MSWIQNKVEEAFALNAQVDRPEIWIHLRSEEAVLADAARVQRDLDAGLNLPLAGQIFVAKGNIAIKGYATTAGCPAFGSVEEEDATVVTLLRDAGAILMGATNLDQFATGLVGVRSPYGAVRHAFLPDRISGGSSSGSAVAVALGIVDFSLGTDTAGSGRVPAALHGLFGIKPTRGLLSNAGVVPACRSLDCVTIFARDLELAQRAFDVAAQFDKKDVYSRQLPEGANSNDSQKVGIPKVGQLGELAPGWQEQFDATVSKLKPLGFEAIPIDIEPLLTVAQMLYDGAFVAERYTAVGKFIDENFDKVDPTVGSIISSAKDIPAHKLYADFDLLATKRLISDQMFDEVDAILLPTTTYHPTLQDLIDEPITANSRLGRFTNFANLLDLAAIAFPAGRVGEEHFGVQLVGKAFSDNRLALIASKLAE